MKPIIRVYDHDLTLIGEVHDASSAIFSKKWSTYGDFEIHLDRPNPLFKNGRYVMFNGDPYKCGVIEYDQDDGDGYQYNSTHDYVVKGFSLLFLLSHRITVPTEANDGYLVWNNKPAEDIMHELVSGQAVNPTDYERIIPNLVMGENHHRGKPLVYRSRYKYLTDDLYTLSVQSGLGVAIRLDPVAKKFVFEVLEGVDRRVRAGTEINRNGYIFSQMNRKVKKHTYTHDSTAFKSMAYVAGQGDGAERTIATIGDTLTGLSRREAFVDARDIADDATIQALKDRGQAKLATDFREIVNFEYEAEADDYRILWDLGDLCTYNDAYKDITLHQQITEVTETYEDGQLKVDPIFGYSENTVGTALSSVGQAVVVERTGISAKFSQIYADYAEINRLVAGKADITELDAITANVTDLTANVATVRGNLTAAVAGIDTLTVQHADLTNLVAQKANIESVTALEATITDLTAANVSITGRLTSAEGTIGTLTADNVTIKGDLSTVTATVQTLSADVTATGTLLASKADIDLANVKAGSITTAMIGEGVVDTAQIKDGSITDAKIVGLTASKITAGRLDAGTIEVVNLNASNITTGTINGQIIAPGTVNEGLLDSDTQGKLNTSLETALDALDTANSNYLKVLSQGQNLITNGSGLMGDNTNFSGFNFTGAEAAGGASGSFYRENHGSTWKNVFCDEYFPIDTTKNYKFSFFVKSTVPKKMYSFVDVYDADKNSIMHADVSWIKGTTTTLVHDLKDGDTEIHLASLEKWATTTGADYYRGFIFWNYKNSGGYEYPLETYSRNNYHSLYDESGVDKENNVISLKSPWAHGTYPAGTAVSQINPGPTYAYGPLSNTDIPQVWTRYQHVFGPSGTKFRNYAAYARIGWTMDTTGVAEGRTYISNISFGEYNASQVDMDAAKGTLDNWSYDDNQSYINGGKIYAATVAAQQIAAGAITADKIVSGAVTADKLAANSVTANAIAAGSITATNGKIVSIDAGKITTGFLDAARIRAGSLTVGLFDDSTQAKVTAGETALSNVESVSANLADNYTDTATLNQTLSEVQSDISKASIANWAYDGNVTYIDGGRIFTGTIDATKINATSLSAISSDLGTITTGKIQSTGYGSGSGLMMDFSGGADGIEVKSTVKNTTLKIDADGTRVYANDDLQGAPTAQFTDKGMESKELYVANSATIAGLLVSRKPDGEIWITGVV